MILSAINDVDLNYITVSIYDVGFCLSKLSVSKILNLNHVKQHTEVILWLVLLMNILFVNRLTTRPWNICHWWMQRS